QKPAVFLAGGIGITPFLSMTLQAHRERSERDIYLFYANRRPEDAAFLDVLQETAAVHKKLRLIPTMSEMEHSARPWDGERGTVSAEMLARHVRELKGPIY